MVLSVAYTVVSNVCLIENNKLEMMWKEAYVA
jgi:hypothetical protein